MDPGVRRDDRINAMKNRKVILALLFFAVFVMVTTLMQNNSDKEFMRTAAKTTGRIMQKEDRPMDPSKPNENRKEHWLHYNYSVNGMEYRKQDRIEIDDVWASFRESYPIDIYYNPSNPAQSTPALVIDKRMGVVNKRTW
jgi:hypothetical protein